MEVVMGLFRRFAIWLRRPTPSPLLRVKSRLFNQGAYKDISRQTLTFHVPSAPRGVAVADASMEQLHEMLRLRDISSNFAVLELESRGLGLPDWYDDPRNHIGFGRKALMEVTEGRNNAAFSDRVGKTNVLGPHDAIETR